eukprot:6175469-Pleurochrysis_carterae.AAC.2
MFAFARASPDRTLVVLSGSRSGAEGHGAPRSDDERGRAPKSGKRSTRSYTDASFPANFSMLRCVGQAVRALRSV